MNYLIQFHLKCDLKLLFEIFQLSEMCAAKEIKAFSCQLTSAFETFADKQCLKVSFQAQQKFQHQQQIEKLTGSRVKRRQL